MTIILYGLCAVALVVTGAVVSGGLRLPIVAPRPSDCTALPESDDFSRDLAALMNYGQEEPADEI